MSKEQTGQLEPFRYNKSIERKIGKYLTSFSFTQIKDVPGHMLEDPISQKILMDFTI
jgi:hypothetical protein